MVYREKLNQLLADVQELESLIGKLLTEEVPGVQLLSKSSSCAYSILEGIKEIESEQIRQMNARLVERQDELSHLSVLLDQYQRMAEACKKDILATKQEDEALRFIDTNLSWDMNNETVADFIKLLEKRYI